MAKRFVRLTFIRLNLGKFLPFRSKENNRPKPVTKADKMKKAQYKIKLDKKLNEMAEDRKAKKKDAKK